MPNAHVIRSLSPYVLVLIFLVFKIFHLNISFFWDESWVYAPALRTMAELGPSLLPDSIALDYSRGHPLLFHFLGSSWIRIFGDGFVSMHSFALMISIVFLLVTIQLINLFERKYLAFWTVLLLCVQPIFVAQSSMVLPEMLLATLTICSIYFYARAKHGLYILFGVLTILTKETGILIIGVIVLYDFINNIRKKETIANILKKGVIMAIPLITLLIHMLYLKSVFGWYLYPEHTGLIKNNFTNVLIGFGAVIKDQIWSQWRFLISIPFIILYAIELISRKNFPLLLMLFVGIILSVYFEIFYGNFLSVSLLYLLFAGHFTLDRFIKGNKIDRLMLLFFIFIVIYGLFSAANFYTVRYLLSTLLLSLFIPIYFLVHDSILKKYIPFLCLLITPVFIYQLFHPKSINDINLSYLSYCPIQSEVVRYLEEEDLYNERINTKFLLSVALKDPLAGYRNTENSFKYVNEGKEDGPAYFIFYNVEQDERKNGFNGKMLKRFEKNHIWFEVWKSGE